MIPRRAQEVIILVIGVFTPLGVLAVNGSAFLMRHLASHGYVVAEGQIQGVRSEVKEQPMQIEVRCDRPSMLAALLFQQDHIVEAKVSNDTKGLLLRTRDADNFYLLLNRVILESGLEVESIAPADDDVNSVYQYLIGGEGGAV